MFVIGGNDYLRFQRSEPSKFTQFGIIENDLSKQAMIWLGPDGKILFTFDDFLEKDVYEINFTWDSNPHTFKISIIENTLNLYIDNELKFTQTSSKVPNETVRLLCSQWGAINGYIDSIKIYPKLTSELKFDIYSLDNNLARLFLMSSEQLRDVQQTCKSIMKSRFTSTVSEEAILTLAHDVNSGQLDPNEDFDSFRKRLKLLKNWKFLTAGEIQETLENYFPFPTHIFEEFNLPGKYDNPNTFYNSWATYDNGTKNITFELVLEGRFEVEEFLRDKLSIITNYFRPLNKYIGIGLIYNEQLTGYVPLPLKYDPIFTKYNSTIKSKILGWLH